jgi:hypothetical protein
MESSNEKSKKILDEFNGIEGLNDVVNGFIGLSDSEVYNDVYEVSAKGHEEGLTIDKYGKNLLEIPQVKHAASVLKNPPIYLPPLTDVITAITFISTEHVIIWVYYTYTQQDLSHKDVLKVHTIILERLISSLNNFNTVKNYKTHDEEFYKKLKEIKWDKTGKKLFKEMSDLRFKTQLEIFRSDFTSFGTAEGFALTFLAACNAVNQGRNKILPEDVVVAYRSYLKLLNTDITKLEV